MENIPTEYLERLVASTPRSIQAVLKAKGGSTLIFFLKKLFVIDIELLLYTVEMCTLLFFPCSITSCNSFYVGSSFIFPISVVLPLRR